MKDAYFTMTNICNHRTGASEINSLIFFQTAVSAKSAKGRSYAQRQHCQSGTSNK